MSGGARRHAVLRRSSVKYRREQIALWFFTRRVSSSGTAKSQWKSLAARPRDACKRMLGQDFDQTGIYNPTQRIAQRRPVATPTPVPISPPAMVAGSGPFPRWLFDFFEIDALVDRQALQIPAQAIEPHFHR